MDNAECMNAVKRSNGKTMQARGFDLESEIKKTDTEIDAYGDEI